MKLARYLLLPGLIMSTLAYLMFVKMLLSTGLSPAGLWLNFCVLTMLPAVVLGLVLGQLDQLTQRSRHLQLVGIVLGLYLTVASPEILDRLYAANRLGSCRLGLLSALSDALYLAGVIGAVLVLCVGLFEALIAWMGQIDTFTHNLPIAAGRIVLLVLLIAVMGERLAGLLVYRMVPQCIIIAN